MDSKFELRPRFADLRIKVLDSAAIATVSTAKTLVSNVPFPAIELEFAFGAVIALLDTHALRTYVNPWVAKKFSQSFTEEPEFV